MQRPAIVSALYPPKYKLKQKNHVENLDRFFRQHQPMGKLGVCWLSRASLGRNEWLEKYNARLHDTYTHACLLLSAMLSWDETRTRSSSISSERSGTNDTKSLPHLQSSVKIVQLTGLSTLVHCTWYIIRYTCFCLLLVFMRLLFACVSYQYVVATSSSSSRTRRGRCDVL